MNRIILFFLLLVFSGGLFAQVGTLTVTVLDSQAGSGLTEIEYEISGPDGAYDISAEVDFGDGEGFLPIDNADIISGNMANVEPGAHTIIWDGEASFDDRYSENTVVSLTATQVCGDTYSVTFTYNGEEVSYGTVWRVGLCWLDRNLGADPMPFDPAADAGTKTDTRLYGDLFQWGRGDDGHQMRDPLSGTTSTLSNTDDPGHDEFIMPGSSPYDWRSDNNNDRWNANPQENNPCPPGWRVPTEAQLDAERSSWEPQNSAEAFASTLKWPVVGGRDDNGVRYGADSRGNVWSSSVSGNLARHLRFASADNSAGFDSERRSYGMSVRCVRNIE